MAISLNGVDAVLALALGYLLGSIPFGLLLTRSAGTIDLRSIGSGNIGATNVLRTGRKDLAAATLVLDALKATLAYVLAALLFHDEAAALAAAVGAFLGHLYPVWLRFRGGKGVATFVGGLIAACWPAAIGFAVVWLAVAAVTRYSSLAALLASLAAPLVALAVGSSAVASAFGLLALLLWLKHSANIARLLKGTESKIGRKGAA
ncbi:MAG: glycerol-3-phosphate 1-O-acyltransferase PlsY [Hyphomicrobiales bacterium]|nr:glycerol-3-phosphate 1-O-acyltransferase PlsY [Hyphomicrobiales bacterium]